MIGHRDNDAEKIAMRRWEDIRREWRDHVPDHDSPWPVPELEIYELPTVEERLRSFETHEKRDVTVETIEDEIPGLREAAIHESVIFVHKAANVLRAAADEGVRGYRTWSRSTAYHAAFFAMRGVLGILGVIAFPRKDRKSDFQIDLWAPRVQKRKPGPTESQFAVRIMPRGKMQHKEMWGLFRRLLCATKIGPEVWPFLGNDILKKLDLADFSRIRHKIHYRSAGWLFEDIDSLTQVDDVAGLAEQVVTVEHLADPEDQDFPASLALHILSLGVALISDLGRDIPRLKAEAERAEKWMAGAPWKCANAFAMVGKGGVK